MADKKKQVTFYGLPLYQGAFLLVRKQGESDWAFPAIPVSGFGKEGKLVKGLREVFGLEIPETREVPELLYKNRDVREVLHSYFIPLEQLKLAEVFECKLIEDEDGICKNIEPISLFLLKRMLIYKPFYERRERTVPLLPADQERAQWQIGCIEYFKNKIPGLEREEFEGLVGSASSVRQINEAFAQTCNAHHAHPRQYIRYLEYREKRRKELL